MEQLDFLNPQPDSSSSEEGPKAETPEAPQVAPAKKTKVRYRSEEDLFGEPIDPDSICPCGNTYRSCQACRFKLSKEKPKKLRGRKAA